MANCSSFLLKEKVGKIPSMLHTRKELGSCFYSNPFPLWDEDHTEPRSQVINLGELQLALPNNMPAGLVSIQIHF